MGENMFVHGRNIINILENQVQSILNFYSGRESCFPWERIWEPTSGIYEGLNNCGLLTTKLRLLSCATIQTLSLSLNDPNKIPYNCLLVSANMIFCIKSIEAKYKSILKSINKNEKKVHQYVDEIEKLFCYCSAILSYGMLEAMSLFM